jgi:hypothetical protein
MVNASLLDSESLRPPVYIEGEQMPETMSRIVFAREKHKKMSRVRIILLQLAPSILLREEPSPEAMVIVEKRSQLLSIWLNSHTDEQGRLDIRRIGYCIDTLVHDAEESGREEGAIMSLVRSTSDLQLTDRIDAKSKYSGVYYYEDSDLIIGDVHIHPDNSGPSALDVLNVATEFGKGLSMVAHQNGVYALLKESDRPIDLGLRRILDRQLKAIHASTWIALKERGGIICKEMSRRLHKFKRVAIFLEERGADLIEKSQEDFARFCNKLGVRIFYKDKGTSLSERYLLEEITPDS